MLFYMNIVMYECCSIWMLLCMNAVLYECCYIWMLFYMNVVLYECCYVWMLFCINAVLYECCSIWMLLCVNVVLYECCSAWMPVWMTWEYSTLKLGTCRNKISASLHKINLIAYFRLSGCVQLSFEEEKSICPISELKEFPFRLSEWSSTWAGLLDSESNSNNGVGFKKFRLNTKLY